MHLSQFSSGVGTFPLSTLCIPGKSHASLRSSRALRFALASRISLHGLCIVSCHNVKKAESRGFDGTGKEV